jgi:hypothetical protein
VLTHFSDEFHVQNGLKQGDALSPLLPNLTLTHTIRKVQKIQSMELNGTGQLLGYVDDVNILGENTNTLCLTKHHAMKTEWGMDV